MIDTKLIIDHCGFFKQGDTYDDESWQKLLLLSKTSDNVYVKVSALFRLSLLSLPYLDLDDRLGIFILILILNY